MDAANATLQKLREMNLSSSSGSSGGDAVRVRPSAVQEAGSAETAGQARDAAMPAQVLPEGPAAAQQTPATPLDPQAVRVGHSVVNSGGSEPAAGDIVVGDDAPAAADEDAGDAGFPAQPRASAGVTTGFGGAFGCQTLSDLCGLLRLPSAALLSAVLWLQQALQKPQSLCCLHWRVATRLECWLPANKVLSVSSIWSGKQEQPLLVLPC